MTIQLAIQVRFTGAVDPVFTFDITLETPREGQEVKVSELLRKMECALGDLRLSVPQAAHAHIKQVSDEAPSNQNEEPLTALAS